MNRDRIIVLLLLALSGFSTISIAQKNNQVTVNVTGRVFDDLKAPLNGVLILNSAGKAAISDQNGEFTIKAKVSDKIAFELVGYDRTVAKVNDGKLDSAKIVMQRTGFFNPKTTVDIPFAKISSVSSTGSVIRVAGEQLQKHPGGQIFEALTGLIPGLQVRQTSARPGLETFQVRYHGDNVRVLIDGIPASQNLGLMEIDEVVLMRGASATAFMGEIGADGLLLIKTKRGNAGPRNITAQAEVSVGVPASMAVMQNSYNYAQTINSSLINDGLNPFYSEQDLNGYKNHSDPLRYPDINYNNLVFSDLIKHQQFSTQVSGGDENTKYFADFSYNGLMGMENSPNRRSNEDFNFRSNLDIRLTSHLLLDVGLVGAFKDQHSTQIATGTTWTNVNSIPPNAFPLMLGDSLYITSQQYGTNMKYEMQEGGYDDKTDRVMSINIGLDFDLSQLTDGLRFKVRGSGDVWNQSELALNNAGDEYELLFEPLAGGGNTMVLNQTAWRVPAFSPSSIGTSVRRQYNFSGLLSYNKIFGDNAIDAGILSYLYQDNNDSQNKNRFVSQSYNLRGNYVYKNKYAAEAIFNFSGSNKVEKENRYKFLPTFGASWLLSEEPFLKESDAVDYLKLRGSWGQQGYLTSFSNYYSFLDDWSTSSSTKLFGVGSISSGAPTSVKDQSASKGIAWPVKTTTNIGFDALFLDNTLSIQADYFNFKKTGLIVQGVRLDMAGGDPYYAYSNQNQVSGNAFEIGLSYNKHMGDFRYTIGANFGYTKATRTKYAEPAYANSNELMQGDATDAVYGLVDNGLFASNAEALNAGQFFGATFKSDIKYQDVNNDGKVDYRDTKVIGNSDPRMNYGVNLNLSYKAVSMYINGAGFAGYDINLNSNGQYQISGFNSRPASVNNNLPNGKAAPRLTVLGSNNNYRSSTYWLVPGNFFRLENVELAYNLPAKFADRWFIKRTKVFARGKNLFVISKFNDSDPEYIDGGFIDYPIFKEYSIGLNLSF